jgi:hypothetical protein
MNADGNFLMSSERRKELLNKSASAFLQKSMKEWLIIIVSFLVIGGGLLVFGILLPGSDYLFGFHVEEWSDTTWIIWAFRIGGALLLCFIPLLLILQARGKSQAIADLNAKHGGLEKVVDSIKEHLRKELPAYTNTITKVVNGNETVHRRFDIVGDWYVEIGVGIEKISDIAAILGIQNRGTFLVLQDQKICDVSFGASNWGAVFALFKEVNPHILYTTDSVTLSNGREADVKAAFDTKDYAAIVKQYQNTKGVTQV